MKQLIISRFEGKYAICEDEEQKCFAIELQEIPKEAREGTVLEITEEGTLQANLEETEARKKAALELQRKNFGFSKSGT